MTDTTATPEMAPVTVEAGLANVLATLAAEDATETAATPETGAETEAEPHPAQDGDSEQEPEAQDGEEAADEAETDDAEPAALPATVKVKVNGEELEVPLDEALKGYSRTEDYKAKTAALADERRSLQGRFAEALSDVTRQVEMFDPLLTLAAQTDWAALSKDDPAEYVARKEAVEQRQNWLAAAKQEVAQFEQQQLAATIQAETAALVAAIPALSEPAAWRGFIGDLTGYLKANLKFDDDTINSVTDHRFYLLAEKARKYDEGQKARATLPAKQVAPKPVAKSLRPSAPVAAPVRKPGPQSSEKDRLAWVISQL